MTFTSAGILPLQTVTYDAVSNLSITVNRTFDDQFRLYIEQVNGGPAVTFAYDDEGLLQTAGALTVNRSTSHGLLKQDQMTYSSALGRHTGINLPGGLGSVGYGFTPTTGHLTSLTGPMDVDLGFGYDGHLMTDVTWSGLSPSVGDVTLHRAFDTHFRVTDETLTGTPSVPRVARGDRSSAAVTRCRCELDRRSP